MHADDAKPNPHLMRVCRSRPRSATTGLMARNWRGADSLRPGGDVRGTPDCRIDMNPLGARCFLALLSFARALARLRPVRVLGWRRPALRRRRARRRPRSRACRGGRGEWLAASLGCTVADTIFNPLEVLKVRRQIAVASTTAASAAPSSSASSSTLESGALGDRRARAPPRALAPRPRGDVLPRLLLHRLPHRHVPVRPRRGRADDGRGRRTRLLRRLRLPAPPPPPSPRASPPAL